jgi:hypothetical protein
MRRIGLLAAVTVALVVPPVLLDDTGAALAQATQPGTTQTSPLATQPLPTEGQGQAPMSSAVTGSAPAPDTTSTIDKSQEQQGKLLKPGPGAGDMNAASGASSKAGQQPQ